MPPPEAAHMSIGWYDDHEEEGGADAPTLPRDDADGVEGDADCHLDIPQEAHNIRVDGSRNTPHLRSGRHDRRQEGRADT